MPTHIPIVDGTKFCPRCKNTLSIDAFSDDIRAKTGKRSNCKECRKSESTRKPLLKEANANLSEKTCSKCSKLLPIASFSPIGKNSLKRLAACRQCRQLYVERWYVRKRQADTTYTRRRYLEYEFGLTEQDYADMLQKQNGVCAICLKCPANEILSVDHSHISGEIRGLLCKKCNTVLGLANDDIEIFSNATSYLNNAATATDLKRIPQKRLQSLTSQ